MAMASQKLIKVVTNVEKLDIFHVNVPAIEVVVVVLTMENRVITVVELVIFLVIVVNKNLVVVTVNAFDVVNTVILPENVKLKMKSATTVDSLVILNPNASNLKLVI